MAKTLKSCRFIFIAGVEGSGTTLFAKLLSEPQGVLALGGNYFSDDLPGFSVEQARARLQALTRNLWGEDQTPETRQALIEEIAGQRVPEAVHSLVYKRSFPFGAVGRSPRLADLALFAPDFRVIWIDRPITANAASILRRGMAKTAEEAAHRALDGARAIAREIAGVPGARLLKIDYPGFVEGPERDLARLERFLGYEAGTLLAYKQLIKTPSAESKALAEAHEATFAKLLNDE